MLEQLTRKQKTIFLASLIINAGLIIYLVAGFAVRWYVDSSGTLDMAQYNYIKNKMCEQNYQRILDDLDKQYAERAEGLKNSFAINVCLRNYKTGEQLDLQPLVDQVNKTD